MARPIKETPTLYGEDARRLEQAINNPQPVSAEEVRRAEDVYRRFMSIANFAL